LSEFTTAEELLKHGHSGVRVLLAEDNPVNRLVAEELLRSVGLVVESVGDGAKAIELALSRPYALILMDVQMPEVDGLAATHAIRERLGTSIPIIAMSGDDSTDDRVASRSAGMDDHIAKPVDPRQLFETLLVYIRRSSSPRT
jgi:two-component system sensor histidine kinase/response regulator